MIRTLIENAKCEFPDCDQPATMIAAGRDDESNCPVGLYCQAHGETVADQH